MKNDEGMRRIIIEKLSEIEGREHVRILYAVESGSRAWGFASPDSDYDVRFIYVRPRTEYLRLHPMRDVIEWQLDDTLDINGWDLKKALGLLHKQNPTLFEWHLSPIVYKTTPEWEEVAAVVGRYFQEKSGVYHYLTMAKRKASQWLYDENIRLKRYFYVLRPILACRWILDRGTPPPMLFSMLAEAYLPEGLRPITEELLRRKMASSERLEGAPIPELHRYIEASFAEIEEALSQYAKTPPHPWEELDALFLRLTAEPKDSK